MSVLDVRDLCKNYPAFQLKNVSFSLEAGKITGFIGRNGAGKTTTLKSLLRFIHPSGGSVSFFGQDIEKAELAIKQRIGFVSGGFDAYQKKKIKTITAATRPFYDQWDEKAYAGYMARFALDESKTPSQLSAGMRVKYALALALSHHAELLILDEPTSGLDPVSRDELLDILLDLCAQGVTILFSTHIISDLDKCADNILYIKNGALIADCPLEAFARGYAIYWVGHAAPPEGALGIKRGKDGLSVLLRADDPPPAGAEMRKATLEEIMVHLEKEGISGEIPSWRDISEFAPEREGISVPAPEKEAAR